MTKRNKKSTRANRATATRTSASATAMEQRVGAFAAQLGRMVGTIQATAEAWTDREVLSQQLASVRDGATHMLEQLAASMTTATTTKKTKTKKRAATARAGKMKRSGGVADAPGKTRRKRAPADRGATIARSQAAKKRTATPIVKTKRHRGRAAGPATHHRTR